MLTIPCTYAEHSHCLALPGECDCPCHHPPMLPTWIIAVAGTVFAGAMIYAIVWVLFAVTPRGMTP